LQYGLLFRPGSYWTNDSTGYVACLTAVDRHLSLRVAADPFYRDYYGYSLGCWNGCFSSIVLLAPHWICGAWGVAMRVNVYAEELCGRVDLIVKDVEGQKFTAVRFWLELPVTIAKGTEILQVKGPFIHRPGDDDSSAVTFWGKRDLIPLLQKALMLLEAHYAEGADTPGPHEANETSEAVQRKTI
jgi:hypothetical protein